MVVGKKFDEVGNVIFCVGVVVFGFVFEIFELVVCGGLYVICVLFYFLFIVG